jgi:L-2,4-diaminobutyrate decarboxylase
MVKFQAKGITTANIDGSLTYRLLMAEAINIAGRWLEASPLFNGTRPEALRDQLSGLDFFPEYGVGDRQVLLEAKQYFLEPALQVHHPLCIAHLHCPTTIASQLAEVLINVSNQSLDSWDQSPSATIIEESLITALRARIGYDSGDSGVFTSGGTQSNLMGLLLARDRYAQSRWGVSVMDDGLPLEARNMVVVCSSQAHFSVQQSLSLLGLGKNSAISVQCDKDGNLSADDVDQVLDELVRMSHYPFAIVATAGTTDTGAIDPLQDLCSIAHNRGLWLHVDAAWGGALILSKKYRHRLNGIHRADSITLDFHKQFFQTISCGAFLLREPAHFELMRMHADYLNSSDDELDGVPNLVSKSLQTTRRFDALKLWMSLRSLGVSGYAELIDGAIDLASEVATMIDLSSKFELVARSQMSSVMFRVRREWYNDQEKNAFHLCLAKMLLDRGIANIGVTRRSGLVTLKMTLLNPSTSIENIRMLLTTIDEYAGAN